MKGFSMRLILLLSFLLFSLRAESEYKLGEGFQVASLPLYVGGYISSDIQIKENEKKYRLDDIAFLAYGGYGNFSYLAEFEFKDFYTYIDKDGETSSEQDRNIHTERLYVDYNYDENFALHLGKYNSTIGFWNLLPINVLRETTSSPQSTYILFPKFTTGLDDSYSSYSEGELRINTTLQHNKSIDDGYNNYNIDEHYAFGLAYELDEYTVKLNGGYFHAYDQETSQYYYMMLSGRYESEKIQVLAEFGSQRDNNEFTTKYAGYVQGVYRFTQKHIGIMRVESFDDTKQEKQDNIAIIGYTYRPLYPIALKTEYQFHKDDDDNAFLFSFSVLF
jgi:hypothetical protein